MSSGRGVKGANLERLAEMFRSGRQMSGEVAAEALGLVLTAGLRHVKTLYDAGRIHVVDHARGRSGRGVWVRIYAWGNGPDAVKPEPLTNLEKVRRYHATEKGKASIKRARAKAMAKRKTDPEEKMKAAVYCARYQFRKNGPKPVAKADPLLAALMGLPR